MADKGIIFSAPMVRALLDGRKTQTRRLLKSQPAENVTSAGVHSNSREGVLDQWEWLSGDPRDCDTWGCEGEFNTGYQPGDRLYVRERFRGAAGYDHIKPSEWGNKPIWFDADGDPDPKLWWHLSEKSHPSIHLPRWASRLWLLVTDVRVQRLRDISEADVDAECFGGGYPGEALPELFPGPADQWAHLTIPECFAALWNSLHTKPGERWEDNPWIVAVSFEVNRGNIDAERRS